MTGDQVRTLRKDLGLTVPQFAELLGASPPSVWRWEAAGAQPARIEPFQLRLLALVQQQAAKPAAAREAFIAGVISGLAVGGGLLGLYKLLDAVFADDVTARRSGVALGARCVLRPNVLSCHATEGNMKKAAKKATFYSGQFCGPCIEMKEIIEGDPALKEAIEVVNCDTKTGSKRADAAGIRVTPTFVRPDGKRLEGVPSAARLKKFLGGGA